MTLRPPTVLTRTVRYAHDGGRLLEHLAAAGLIATTDDGSRARPLDAVLLESVDIATKVSRTTIAVLEACARLTCQGPTVTVEALPRAPADGRAARGSEARRVGKEGCVMFRNTGEPHH